MVPMSGGDPRIWNIMNEHLAIFASTIVIGLSSPAWAQDASQQQTPPPQSQQDTTSPLTPTSPNGSSPLTPTQPNPVNQPQPTSAAAVQSSSEPPETFVQPPIEANRIDPSAPSDLSLQIDPASAEASLLNPDASGLAPTAAGVSLNSVQGTTSTAAPSSLGVSIPSPTSVNVYPATLSEPASTQAFLTALQTPGLAGRTSASRVGSSSSVSTMGPAIGSAAVHSSSLVETMSSAPTAIGSSMFMRSPSSPSTIQPSVAAASFGSSSIGPRALRSSFGSSSSMSFSHSRSGGHR